MQDNLHVNTLYTWYCHYLFLKHTFQSWSDVICKVVYKELPENRTENTLNQVSVMGTFLYILWGQARWNHDLFSYSKHHWSMLEFFCDWPKHSRSFIPIGWHWSDSFTNSIELIEQAEMRLGGIVTWPLRLQFVLQF